MLKWLINILGARDTRGQQSTTLGFVVISFTVLIVKFALGGLTLGVLGDMPVISAGEFGAALVVVLGIWRHREYTERVKAPEAKNNGGHS